MEFIRKTYVTFDFCRSFISESEDNEDLLFGEEKTTRLEPGTLQRVLEQYEEVEVADRSLAMLKVPKGTLRFYFYDRITTTAYEDGEAVTLHSNERKVSGWYYLLDKECLLITREDLLNADETKYHLTIRNHLLDQMDKNDCDCLFETDEGEDIALATEDIVVKPEEVQMVDTEIPWPG